MTPRGGFPSLNQSRAFLLLVIVAAWLPCAHAAREPLYVSVYADRSIDDGLVTVTVYGRVTGLNQSAVALAAVSIQVNDPYGSSLHIAFLYSDSEGAYSDAFQLPSDRPTGNYTIYITASKPGFEDAHATLTFLVGISPFAISVFPASVAVKQGEDATFRIMLESREPRSSRVHVDVVGLPATVSYSLSANNATVPASVMLSVKVPDDFNPGTYRFTVTARSTEGESTAEAEIVVSEPERTGYHLVVAFLAFAVAVVLGVVAYRRRTRRDKTPTPPSPSPEYLEGLPLSSSTLLALPDHLRKTTIIVCQMKEATAAEVATRSGKARAAESDYLNQLVRMGILKKKRKGRESYFSVE